MSKRKRSESLQFATLFFVFVGAVIFLSLIFRLFFLFKESKFDGSSHFTLKIENGRTQFVSFSPQDSTIGILTFQNAPAPFEIPIDARIRANLEVDPKNLNSSLFKMIFEFQNQKEVNSIDIFRLLFFSETVKKDSISQILITDKTDKIESDSIISSFFIDPQISEEKLNIEVINVTDVYGLGNRYANLVTNMGGNVVLVSTGEFKKESVIEYAESSYTEEKIAKILKFKKIKKEKITRKSVADVTLIIGENHVR